MPRLESHYFVTHNEITELGKYHQWLLEAWDQKFKATGYSHSDKVPSQSLSANWKGKTNLYKGAIYCSPSYSRLKLILVQ